MKVLLIASLLSILFVVNARISDEVLSCRWNVFKSPFTVLYDNIDESTAPRKEVINRFCSKVGKYEECVANVESEQLTVELMQRMCEYGFYDVYNNITCLQKAVNKIRSTCFPGQTTCARSIEWFQCSAMVIRDLCGEALTFIMEVFQPFYCEITGALQSDQPIPYDLVPFHEQVGSSDVDDEEQKVEKKEADSKESHNPKAKTETDSSAKVNVKLSTNPKLNTKYETRTMSTQGETNGPKPHTSVQPKTSVKPTHGTTKGPKPHTSVQPETSVKPTHGTTKGPKPHTSVQPKTSMNPTHGTTKGPKPHTSVKPTTSMKPTHGTTKGPKAPTTTHSGNSKLASSGNFVLSVVVGTLLMKNL